MTDDHKADPLDLDALERDVQGTPQHRFIKVRVLALISELRTARSALADAWDEGYVAACNDHNNFDGCGKPNAHGHSNANPYREGSTT